MWAFIASLLPTGSAAALPLRLCSISSLGPACGIFSQGPTALHRQLNDAQARQSRYAFDAFAPVPRRLLKNILSNLKSGKECSNLSKIREGGSGQ